MKSDFEILCDFLSHQEPEASGRSSALSDEMKAKLDKLAEGSISGKDRESIAEEVVSDDSAIAYLANAIKANR